MKEGPAGYGRPASAQRLRPVGRRLQRQREAGGLGLRSEAAVRLGLRGGGYCSIRQGLRELAYDIKGRLAPGSVPLPGMV